MSEYEFWADVIHFTETTKIRADQVIRKVALDIYAEVLRRSPVDTGRFRGNWRVGIGRTQYGVDDGGASRGVRKGEEPRATEEARASEVILQAGAGDLIIISNNLPYARGLENGRSAQNRHGILAPSIDKVTTEFEAAVRRIRGGG